MAEGRAPQNRTQIYNLITVAALALAIALCFAVLLAAITWPRTPRVRVAGVPTLMGLPTFTPPVEGPTANPSWTPETESAGEDAPGNLAPTRAPLTPQVG